VVLDTIVAILLTYLFTYLLTDHVVLITWVDSVTATSTSSTVQLDQVPTTDHPDRQYPTTPGRVTAFGDCAAADFREMANGCWTGNGSGFDALASSAESAVVGSHNFWTLLLLAFPVLTVFGNVLVVLGVYRERSLQSATNYFIVSLAIADIMVAILVMPLAVYVEVRFIW